MVDGGRRAERGRPRWLPAPDVPASARGERWRPRSLIGLDVDLAQLCYVLVEEKVGAVIGLRVARWPAVDEEGQPLFSDPEEELDVAVEEDELQRRLDAARRVPPGLRLSRTAARELRTRPVALGDVFAVETDLGQLRAAAGVRAAARLRAPVYDITADAREAARQVFYAAVTKPLSASAQAELEQQLEDGR